VLFTNILDNPFAECAEEDLSKVLGVAKFFRGRINRGVQGLCNFFVMVYTLGKMAGKVLEKVKGSALGKEPRCEEPGSCVESGRAGSMLMGEEIMCDGIDGIVEGTE
jgi:hypothetical protein